MTADAMDTLIRDHCTMQRACVRQEKAVRWLADRLSGARVMLSWKQCHDCKAYSFDACANCWEEAAMEAAEEARDD